MLQQYHSVKYFLSSCFGIHKQDKELEFFVPVPVPEFNSTGSLGHFDKHSYYPQQIFLKQFPENRARARARARARNQFFIHDVYTQSVLGKRGLLQITSSLYTL